MLAGFSATMSETAARRLAADPAVAYVEQDRLVSIDQSQSSPPWNLDRSDERQFSQDFSYTPRNAGANVRIYVLDTGVRLTHSEFGGRAATGYDAVTKNGKAVDCNGHGTHVAAIAAGSTFGIAKQARIVSVRVLGCDGTGSVSQIVAGVNWVTANAVRPAVANMSLGVTGSSAGSVDDAVTNSINAGITYVVSAGNNNTNACNQTPARVPGAITVAAVTTGDFRAGFSNFGPCVDIFAPGVMISSAWFTSDTATSFQNGTSIATPHVAGAAAMVLSANPTWTTAQVRRRLNADATTGVLSNAGDGSPDRLLYVGTELTAPIVTRLDCQSGNNMFVCSMAYHSWGGTASVSWKQNGYVVPGWNGKLSVSGNCSSNTVVQAVASNSAGSGTLEWSGCRSGPWL